MGEGMAMSKKTGTQRCHHQDRVTARARAMPMWPRPRHCVEGMRWQVVAESLKSSSQTSPINSGCCRAHTALERAELHEIYSNL